MSKKYIDVDAAKLHLRTWITDCMIDGDNESADRFRDCIDLLDSLPAADVAPVVHGRWVNFYNDYSTAECDQCQNMFEVTFDNETNAEFWECFKQAYNCCPNCGAKMDKEEGR